MNTFAINGGRAAIVVPACSSRPGASNDILLFGFSHLRMLILGQGQVKTTRVTKLLEGCHAAYHSMWQLFESIDGSTNSLAQFVRELLAKNYDCAKQPY